MVSGRHKTLPNGRTTIICEVDGHVTKYSFNDASNHEAEYMATLRALRHAHTKGVTNLEIRTKNHIVDKHRSGEWRRSQPKLHGLQEETDQLFDQFDSVIFV